MSDESYLTDEYLEQVARATLVEALRPPLALHRNGNGAEPEAPATSRFRVYTDTEIEAMPPLTYLVPGVIPLGTLAEIHAAPGVGKSFVVLDLALAVQTGGTWLGVPVEQGFVLYVAAEGSAGLRQRVLAWKAARGWDGRPTGARFVTEAVNLTQMADVVHLLLATKALPEMPTLIVFDTLARSMAGGDENDTEDMSRVVAHLDRLRSETGATVMVVHHTRKDSDEGRGSTALAGAADTMMLLKEEDSRLTLSCTKQKDAPAFTPIAFGLLPTLDSCTIAVQGAAPESDSDRPDQMTPKRRAALCALRLGFTERGASTTEWLKATDVPDRTFYRIRTWLVEHEYVTESSSGPGSRYTLTPTGRFVASDAYVLNQTERTATTATRTATPETGHRGGVGGTGTAPSMAPLKGGLLGDPPAASPLHPGSGVLPAANCQTALAVDVAAPAGPSDDAESTTAVGPAAPAKPEQSAGPASGVEGAW